MIIAYYPALSVETLPRWYITVNVGKKSASCADMRERSRHGKENKN